MTLSEGLFLAKVRVIFLKVVFVPCPLEDKFLAPEVVFHSLVEVLVGQSVQHIFDREHDTFGNTRSCVVIQATFVFCHKLVQGVGRP